MRVDRRYLYAGLFLVALGGVVATANIVPVDTTSIAVVLRAWPVAFIAVGVAIALRRTRLSLPAGALGAAVPGLILGGMALVAPPHRGTCVPLPQEQGAVTQSGSLADGSIVTVDASCGAMHVRTGLGSEWRLDTVVMTALVPDVEYTMDQLQVRATGSSGEHGPFAEAGDDSWELTLPRASMRRLDLSTEFGHLDADLMGTSIEAMSLSADGSYVWLDLSAASVGELDGSMQFSSAQVNLPGGSDFTATLRLAASSVTICAPDGLGLRVATSNDSTEVSLDRLGGSDGVWESPNYTTAAHHAAIALSGSFSDIEIDPIGECS